MFIEIVNKRKLIMRKNLYRSISNFIYVIISIKKKNNLYDMIQ